MLCLSDRVNMVLCVCNLVNSLVVFFFFKQKAAYEMRISDWSSDVCSSDLRALLPLRRADFTVLCGDDPSCANAIARGADGVISVASNVVPAGFVRLCALAASDPEPAASLDSRLAPLYRILACEPNPTPEIGRAPVGTPVPNAQLVCSPLL